VDDDPSIKEGFTQRHAGWTDAKMPLNSTKKMAAPHYIKKWVQGHVVKKLERLAEAIWTPEGHPLRAQPTIQVQTKLGSCYLTPVQV